MCNAYLFIQNIFLELFNSILKKILEETHASYAEQVLPSCSVSHLASPEGCGLSCCRADFILEGRVPEEATGRSEGTPALVSVAFDVC